MKWFNADDYLVVVLESGDVYGPESSLVHRYTEQRIRIFDLKDKRNGAEYPLLADAKLSELGRLGSTGSGLLLSNGQELDATSVAELHKFTVSMLQRITGDLLNPFEAAA